MPEPTLEEFRQEATGFLEANAERRKAEKKEFVWGEGDDNVAVLEEKTREQEQAELVEAKEWRAKRYDAGFGWITGPTEYGGRELPRRLRPRLLEPGSAVQDAEPDLLRHRPRHGGADDPGPRHRRGEGRLPAQALPGRHGRLPAVQRARRRVGPGQPADTSRARRRRVDRQRPEGLDLGRPLQRHRRGHLPHRPRPAQAQGPHRVRRRHEGAGRRDPAAAPDDRGRRSTRSSSPTSGSPTTTASATWTRAGRSPSPR